MYFPVATNMVAQKEAYDRPKLCSSSPPRKTPLFLCTSWKNILLFLLTCAVFVKCKQQLAGAKRGVALNPKPLFPSLFPARRQRLQARTCLGVQGSFVAPLSFLLHVGQKATSLSGNTSHVKNSVLISDCSLCTHSKAISSFIKNDLQLTAFLWEEPHSLLGCYGQLQNFHLKQARVVNVLGKVEVLVDCSHSLEVGLCRAYFIICSQEMTPSLTLNVDF